MKCKISLIALFAIFIISVSCESQQDKFIEPAPIFGDHMVLQANKPVNIWGKATPSARITVLFRDQEVTAKTGKDGHWKVVLDEETYGGPDALVISSSFDTIIFSDVLTGEVWICSGQSNMEMPMISNWANLNNAEEEVANADYPDIRLFTVERNLTFSPVDTIRTNGWNACIPEIAKDFSATGYFFGRKIHKELKVPVGLIQTAWGGTVAEAWTSKTALGSMRDFDEKLAALELVSGNQTEIEQKYREDMEAQQEEIIQLDPGLKDGASVYATEAVDTESWLSVDLPVMWEETELGNFDGSGWFVKDVELPESFAGKPVLLSYGAPDDYDEAWFNGVKVGEDRRWDKVREYEVPSELVQPGMNRIVIRILDNTGGGGFMSEEKDFYIKSENGRVIFIAQGWKAAKGFDFRDVKTNPVSPYNPNQVSVLYNAMIHPLIPFTIRGATWYQGESNAGRAYQYRKLFSLMINDWRTSWGQDDFPFLFVQLAGFQRTNSIPVEDTWAELREAQTMALELPNTGMAVAIDIGDALDIHPGNKQDVGKRLALNALALVYGKDIPYSGPVYRTIDRSDKTISIGFDHVYEGLQTRDGAPLKGFSIAGEDKVFYWADAEIHGGKVEVSSPSVPDPVAVRYGWSINPECNLENSAELPASPFRTDNWKGITE
ncbi:MAG: sialate O-acetylesterase [Bacteroidales bacterium]